VRAVLDANVLISAVLAPAGAPAKLLRLWLDGAYELVVSPRLLAELDRALAYPKLRARVPAQDATELLELLERHAEVVPDPLGYPQTVRSSDPGDDYLIALAAAEGAMLVSGDSHLLAIADDVPVLSPAAFLARLGQGW
jgi:putative PIN family toxin of toxin-antitoxin system